MNVRNNASSIFNGPNHPLTETLRHICPDENQFILTAEGENIVWYATTTYNDTLSSGNVCKPDFKTNRVVYVRQTVNGIASHPRQVTIRFSQIKDTKIYVGPTALMVSNNSQPLMVNSMYRVSPNPATDYLHLESLSAANEAVGVRLYEPGGRIVRTEQECSLPTRLQLTELQPGVYILEITGKGGKSGEKVVKK